MLKEHDATTLSTLFHLNSEPWLNNEAYSAVYHQEFREVPPGVPRVSLPPPEETRLAQVMKQRKSCRTFQHVDLPLATLSTLAMAAAGVVETPSFGDGAFLRRAAPSAGGLYPLELYIFTDRIADLPGGLYHYDVRGHSLAHLAPDLTVPALQPVLYTYPLIEHANAVFAFSAVFRRTQEKYGPRGYRYVLLEAGHAAQDLCLAAAELGLGSLCMGGFADGPLNRMLSLPPLFEGVVYMVAIGVPATNPPAR